ncbi:26S proteasome non-ATPase regulatory subunit 11 homolog [Cornus florida]|uniref:26S proteasome non-ATPase regulatory subunit 11 homolog n=1 Tax=Cornus florida TaxID=4283 RepID=UPI0028980BB3|nr:26S proteasome non-ATPase regulatory subunit 11 homolog [Cornus florida]
MALDTQYYEKWRHLSLRNLPKAKAALTAARTAANAVYVPPAQQGVNSLADPAVGSSMQKRRITKLLTVISMRAVADAYSKRSLKLFEICLQNFRPQLEEDPMHLSSLYDTLLEQNLCRLIEPFSMVEIAYLADLIQLPVDHVEKKLSQMILDNKFLGTLDQGVG